MQQKSEDEPHQQFESKLRKFQQKKREVQCAVTLTKKLQQYVDGDVEGFRSAAREEAIELSQTPFGATLLGVIGKCYSEFTQAELGGVSGLSANMSSTTRGISTRLNIASAGLRAAASAKDAEAAHVALSERERARVEKKATAGDDKSENTVESEDPEDVRLKEKLEKTSGHM
jgi:hypothetical protein